MRKGILGGIKVAASERAVYLIFLRNGRLANIRGLGDASCFSINVTVFRDLLIGHKASFLSSRTICAESHGISCCDSEHRLV